VRFDGGVLPTLVPGADAGLPLTTVERPTAAVIEERWASAPSPRMLRQRFNVDGESVVEVQHAPGVGYRIWGWGHGVHFVAEDGRRLASAPVEGPEWLHPLMLVAQALPLAATLHGRELLHASAVAVDGGVVAMTGPSGAGKSSVATRLLDYGAEFFADDALALERRGGELIAHPGPRFANVHAHEFESLGEAARAHLGASIGQSAKLHFKPQGVPVPLPLRWLVLLNRVPAGEDGTIVAAADATGELLGSAYVPHFDGGTRMLRQLDVLAAVSRSVRVIRVPIRRGEASPLVAERILEHMDASA
jgi:hypothetical protein